MTTLWLGPGWVDAGRRVDEGVLSAEAGMGCRCRGLWGGEPSRPGPGACSVCAAPCVHNRESPAATACAVCQREQVPEVSLY